MGNKTIASSVQKNTGNEQALANQIGDCTSNIDFLGVVMGELGDYWRTDSEYLQKKPKRN
jgi:hypothetical protein